MVVLELKPVPADNGEVALKMIFVVELPVLRDKHVKVDNVEVVVQKHVKPKNPQIIHVLLIILPLMPT